MYQKVGHSRNGLCQGEEEGEGEGIDRREGEIWIHFSCVGRGDGH